MPVSVSIGQSRNNYVGFVFMHNTQFLVAGRRILKFYRFRIILYNVKKNRDVLLNSFQLNGHSSDFYPQTQKLESP